MRLYGPLILLLACACSSRELPPYQNYRRQARPAFVSGASLAPLPLGSVKPKGWLRRQLEIQARGLSGELESFWPSLKDSAWKGGKGDAWERGPYYLDGLVPLAFLLDDKALLKKMQAWMEWNLRSVRPDGSFGPAQGRDWWPDMVMLKVFQQYHEASSDPRVMPLLEGYARHLKAHIGARRLDAWRSHRRYDEQARGEEDLVGNSDRWQFYRWQEMALALLWLEARTGDASLRPLARELQQQGYDWHRHFLHFRYKSKTARDQIFLANHGVNNAMAIKAPSLTHLLALKPQAYVANPYQALMQWHGQPNGAFSADEHLAGLSPSQGTELCAVAETMASLETLITLESGLTEMSDALERLAFNAWPAAFDEGMWAHQYDQQANQVLVTQAWRNFTNNKDRANLFGLEPEWGCCTANFHQGWPKFAASLWMAGEDGLDAVSYAPCEVDVELEAGRFAFQVEGDYPFDGEVRIRIVAAPEKAVWLRMRIPAWAAQARLELPGEAPSHARGPGAFGVPRVWKAGELIKLHFSMQARAEAWGQAVVVRRGPLLLALDLDPQWKSLGPDRWSDKEARPRGPWNLVPLLNPGDAIPDSALTRRPADGNVFDRYETPIRLKLKVRQAANWGLDRDSAADPPLRASLEGPELEADFIPYGAAKLRVSVFPQVP